MQHIVIAPPGAQTALQAFVIPDTREAIEFGVEALIARLDDFDQPSDPDAPDFSSADDGAPGSPDDAEPNEDAERAAWVEWDALRSRAKSGPNFTLGEEDTEDDDAGGDCTDDDPGFDPTSRRIANLHEGFFGAGCPLSGDRELNGDEGDHSY